MHDEARAFDVAQETDTEAGAEMRAFDKSGQIGDNKRAAEFSAVATCAAVGIDDAEIGLECGERIIGDFRTRGGNHRNQCGFACVRETDQPNIGKKFELKSKMAFFAGKAFFVFAWSLMPGLGKMLIAAATVCHLGQSARVVREPTGQRWFRRSVRRKRACRRERAGSCPRQNGRCSSSLRRAGRDRL